MNSLPENPFSSGATRYARYRPSYPDELFDFILGHVPGRSAAWDSGTARFPVFLRLGRIA